MIGTYRFNQKRTAPSTTTITFEAQKVPRNQIVEVTGASIADYTTKNKLMILGIRDANLVDTYVKVVQESSTFCATFEGSLILIEGESLIGIVESPTSSDVCYFTAHGKRYELKTT